MCLSCRVTDLWFFIVYFDVNRSLIWYYILIKIENFQVCASFFITDFLLNTFKKITIKMDNYSEGKIKKKKKSRQFDPNENKSDLVHKQKKNKRYAQEFDSGNGNLVSSTPFNIKSKSNENNEENVFSTPLNTKSEISEDNEENVENIASVTNEQSNTNDADEIKSSEMVDVNEEAGTMEQVKKKKKKKKKNTEIDLETEKVIVTDNLVDMENFNSQTENYKNNDNNEDGNVWTTEDNLRLCSNIEKYLPENETLSYQSRLKMLDWDLVKFDGHTSSNCLQRWNDIQRKVRKYRILKELIDDAKTLIKQNKLFEHQGNQIRKPLSAYLLYYLDTKDKILLKYPGISGTEIAKHVSKRYHKLSANKMEKYKERARLLDEEYKQKIQEYREKNPELQIKKKPKALPRPKTAFLLYRDAQLERKRNEPDFNKVKLFTKCKNKWKKMSESKKISWIEMAKAKETEYNEYMKQYQKEHPSFIQTNTRPTVITKTEQNVLDRQAGKPKKPPTSAYVLYSQEMLRSEQLSDIPTNLRMAEIAKHWKSLSDQEKQLYSDKVKELVTEYKMQQEQYMSNLCNGGSEENAES